MRVIAGIAKGRRLVGPPGLVTRPPTDRAREGLFSALGTAVAGSRVLDLYAGSGSLGIEALSRGAASVVFVERDRAALSALRRNLALTGLSGDVVGGTVERFLAGCADRFDLVFVDPPYSLSLASVRYVLAAAARVTRPGGLVVVHRRVGDPEPEPPPTLRPAGFRRYGDAGLWRYAKEEDS